MSLLRNSLGAFVAAGGLLVVATLVFAAWISEPQHTKEEK